MSRESTTTLALAVSIICISVAYLVGVQSGWEKRIAYELHQCIELGRCFSK